MTPILAACAIRMDGSAISVTHRVLATTILAQKLGLFAQPIQIEMSLERQSPTSCPILLTRFASTPSEISPKELPILYSQGELLRLAWAGVGELIKDLTRTIIISTYLSLRQGIQTARSLISHY